MKNASIISSAAYVSMPWRNGTGTTVEIIKRTFSGQAAGEFAWRLSMADVVEDGQFSNFKNYDRTLVLLEGGGITLNHDGGQEDILSSPLSFARFNGESITTASLHDGPIRDLNIMTYRGLCHAKTRCHSEAGEMEMLTEANTLLVFAVKGDVLVGSNAGDKITASSQSIILIEPTPDAKLCLTGSAFIVVELFLDSSNRLDKVTTV